MPRPKYPDIEIDASDPSHVCIRVGCTDGGTATFLIDHSDLEFVKGRRWRAVWDSTIGGYYIFGSGLLLHRAISGAGKGQQVDHKNHDTLDNRRHNLVLKTATFNQLNRRGAQKNNRLGIRGVSARGKRFTAIVRLDGKSHYLGTFAESDDASKTVKAFLLGADLAAKKFSYGCGK